MTTLLAIIAHDREEPVMESELEELVRVHDGLRGSGLRSDASGPGWVRAATISYPTGQPAGVERGDTGWAAWAGSPRYEGVLVDADPAELDGQFVILRLDRSGMLTLLSDPLGHKPLFIARRGARTYIATSALVLARHLRAPGSRLGFETFLRIGRQWQSESSWEGVERTSPASAVTFGPGAPSRTTYWRPEVDEQIARLSARNAADHCSRAGTDLISSLGGDGPVPWCDLTGGFDSRLLALMLNRAGEGFHANTFGDAASEDVQIAAELSAAMGWRWTRFGLPDDWQATLPERVKHAVAWGDAQIDALQLAEVLWGHEARAATGTKLFGGGGAEQFSGFAWHHEVTRAGRTSTINFERLFQVRVMPAMDASVFASDPTDAVRDATRSDFERILQPYDAALNTLKLDVLHAYMSRGHFGAYQAAGGGLLDTKLPFQSKIMCTAAVSVPAGSRRLHRLARQMISELDPTAARFRTTYGGPAAPFAPRNVHRQLQYPWRRGRKFLRKLTRPRAPVPAAPGTIPHFRQQARRELVRRLRAEGRLDPAQMRSGRLYDPAVLARLVAAAEQARVFPASKLLNRILTVELALEAADSEISG